MMHCITCSFGSSRVIWTPFKKYCHIFDFKLQLTLFYIQIAIFSIFLFCRRQYSRWLVRFNLIIKICQIRVRFVFKHCQDRPFFYQKAYKFVLHGRQVRFGFFYLSYRSARLQHFKRKRFYFKTFKQTQYWLLKKKSRCEGSNVIAKTLF
jgi:hypothetical protein